MDCNQEHNRQRCNCTYPCAKKGACCQCVAYHRALRELPACFFPADAERTYDRSYDYFVKLHREGKLK